MRRTHLTAIFLPVARWVPRQTVAKEPDLSRAFSWYTSRNVRSPHPSGNAGNSTLASAFLTSRQISPNALAFALSHGPGTLNWREA